MPERTFEALERFGVAFRVRFDAAIRQVAHRPVYALALGRLAREPAEADALHPTADQKSPCDAQERMIPTPARRGKEARGEADGRGPTPGLV